MKYLKSVLDYCVRAQLFIAAIFFTALVVFLGVSIASWWFLALAVTLPLLALGIYDFFQRKLTLTRNYPVAAHIRWLFYDLRPYLRQYIVEGDLEGKPFSFEARNLVDSRARGTAEAHPFGTELDVEASGYSWINHSIKPAENPDKSPRTLIGTDQCKHPYSASLLNVSAMSFGALSANAIRALNLGAKIGDYYHDTGEGGLSPYHLEHGGDIVWEIGSGYFGCRNDDGSFNADMFAEGATRDVVKMTEIKLSQGAKPGHGGMLPGAKVTKEIAETRKVPEGQDCLSPRGHSAFSTPCEMLEFAAKMRDLSGGKPVGLKLCVGQIHEVFAIMKAIRKTGILPDFIVVDGAEGGTGAAPLELSNHVGMPLREGLMLMRNALVGTGLKKHIRLGASGKVFSGYGMAENLAIGADWCNAARAFMFSIGCIQAQRCHTDTCPTGVTTQDPIRQRGLVVGTQSKHAARFHEKTLEALADIVAASGLEHPRDLRPHHLSMRANPTDARSVDAAETFIDENQLLDAPDDTIYARHWHAADPDSFSQRREIPPTPAEQQAV